MTKSITDRKGRNITLHFDEIDKIIAIYDDKRIAEFDYERREIPIGYGDFCEESFELYSMNVDGDYQGEGIGTEIIRFGEEVFEGKVSYPKFGASRHENHLSSEGSVLINSCINKGIIAKEKYYEEWDDEY